MSEPLGLNFFISSVGRTVRACVPPNLVLTFAKFDKAKRFSMSHEAKVKASSRRKAAKPEIPQNIEHLLLLHAAGHLKKVASMYSMLFQSRGKRA